MKKYFHNGVFLKLFTIIICLIFIYCAQFLNKNSISGSLLISVLYLFIISFMLSTIYFTLTKIFSDQYKLNSFINIIDHIFSFFIGAFKLLFFFLIFIFVFIFMNFIFNINTSDIIQLNSLMVQSFNDSLYKLINILTIPAILTIAEFFIIIIFNKFFKNVNISIINSFFAIFLIWFIIGPIILYFFSLKPATIISILGFIITLIIFLFNYIIFNKNISITQIEYFEKENDFKTVIRITNNSNKEITINKINFDNINQKVEIVINKGSYFDVNFCTQKNSNSKKKINLLVEYNFFRNIGRYTTNISTNTGNITIQDISKK